MKVYDGLESIDPPLGGTVLTIGNFDGVHQGHQQLLAQSRLLATETGGAVTVLTFEPHPLTIVAPDRAPPRLMTLDEKLRCLREAGAEVVAVAHSTPALLGLEAEDFVHDVIRARFRPVRLVEGPSFRFGRGRRGDPAMLERLAGEFGCPVHVVEPVMVQADGGEPLLVSSSLVRKLIGTGDVQQAALCLGRPYAVVGEIVEGDRRGRTIGFPTANIAPTDQLVPREGVYAGNAAWDEHRFPAAISIGRSPTFDGVGTRIEVHLLDFDGDLYGRTLRVEFERFLREQRKFPSSDALVDQLRRDVEAVREAGVRGGDRAPVSGVDGP